jgi:hypothetical protein
MSKRSTARHSRVIYRGPSLLDGKPIVVVAVWSARNRKTGTMLQTYILRADIHPFKANKSGEDFSICGNCPHRGTATTLRSKKLALNRSCYVNMGQGVLIVWKALARGYYPEVSGHAAIAAVGRGRMVRLGTYGDPAAVPSYIWESLISEASGHTAYSHQSGMDGAAFRPDIMMQSADTLLDAQQAWIAGRRTFRVVASVADIVKGREILCPASEEAGKRTTCAACGLCGGAAVKAKSIAIPVHGAGAVHYAQRVAA